MLLPNVWMGLITSSACQHDFFDRGRRDIRINLVGCRHGLEDPEAREVGTSWT
jgi:hypothetical protein